MNAEQRAARNAFAALVQNTLQADAIYDVLPEAHGGRIISTDLARFLETRYRDTPEGQPRDLLPGWDLAWRYAQARLRREIVNRNGRIVLRFMAGGWGAGKTHALQGAEFADLAWDGTLREYLWAREVIDMAIENGWRVEIAYVFRDIELALYGAVERAKKEGRGVPLRELPGNHRAVQRSILRLLKRYDRHPQIVFLLLHNMGAENVHGKSLVIRIAELAPNGALYYTKRHEDYYAQAAREIEALNPAAG
jgi:hypothetical protein